MIERLLFVLLALVLVASVGAFFLYVPVLSALSIIIILAGLISMFSLGYYAAAPHRKAQ